MPLDIDITGLPDKAEDEQSFLQTLPDYQAPEEEVEEPVVEPLDVERPVTIPRWDEIKNELPEEMRQYGESIQNSLTIASTNDITPAQAFSMEDTFTEAYGEKQLWKKAKGSFKAGFGDVYTTMGGTMEWLGFSKEASDVYRDYGNRLQQAYIPPSDMSEFTMGKLSDSEWWATTGVRSVPFTLSLIPAAIVGAYAGVTAAGAIGLGAFGTTVLGAVGGAALSRPVESAFEAGGAYDEGLAKGMSEEEAQEAADQVFKGNMMLTGVDAVQFAASFTPLRVAGKSGQRVMLQRTLAAITKLGGVGLMEAAEERYQAVITAEALGEEAKFFDFTDPELNEASVIGAIFGMGMGGAGSVWSGLTEHVVETAPPELRKQFDELKRKAVAAGATPEEATLQALDGLADTPEGKAHIESSVGDLQKIAEGNAAQVEDFSKKVTRLREIFAAEDVEAAAVEQAARISQSVQTQLVEAGISETDARAQAEALYGAPLTALAERAGIDPVQLFESYGLTITGEAAAPREVYRREPDVREARDNMLVRGMIEKVRAGKEIGTDFTDAVAQIREKREGVEALAPRKEERRKVQKEMAEEFEERRIGERRAFVRARPGEERDTMLVRRMVKKVRAGQTLGDFTEEVEKIREDRELADSVTYNQDGRVEDGTVNFEEWFGESVVVDEAGNPLVVYHGTPYAGFAKFEKPRYDGIYFTTDPEYAAAFTDKGVEVGVAQRAIYPAYVRLENPKYFDFNIPEEFEAFTGRGFNLEELAAEGYDGILLQNRGKIEDLMVLGNEQIQSVYRGDVVEEGQTFYQPAYVPPVPAFFSQLEKVLRNKMPSKAPGDTVMNIVRKGGVKADEIKWTGIEEFLKGKKSVTKDEVLSYLKLHALEMEDVIKDEEKYERPEEDVTIEEFNDNWGSYEAEEPDADFVSEMADDQVEQIVENEEIDKEDYTDEDTGEFDEASWDEAVNDLAHNRAVEMAWEDANQQTVSEHMDYDLKIINDEINDQHVVIFNGRHEGDYTYESEAHDRAVELVRDYHGVDIYDPEWDDDYGAGEDTVKFSDSDYQEPGGWDYTEFLIRIPEIPVLGEEKIIREAIAERDAAWEEIAAAPGFPKGAHPSEQTTWAFQNVPQPLYTKWNQAVIRANPRPPRYHGGHFDEDNILSHVRFKTREDVAGNKVLFLEEVQSDWMLDARRVGVKGPVPEELRTGYYQAVDKERDYRESLEKKYAEKIEEQRGPLDKLPKDYEPIIDRSAPEDMQWGIIPPGQKHAKYWAGAHTTREGAIEAALTKLNSQRAALNITVFTEGIATEEEALHANRLTLAKENLLNEMNKLEKGVPDAPLLKNWHEFTLKRMVRYAAEEGFDKISWVTGAQTQDRYNLRKKVSKISWNIVTREFKAYNLGGSVAMTRDNVLATDLQTLIGKELADRLLAQESEKPRVETVKVYGENRWGVFVGGTQIDNFETAPEAQALVDSMVEDDVRLNWSTLEGVDLEVGGEWATTLYNKVIPNFLNKFLKKYGVRVGTTKLNMSESKGYVGPEVVDVFGPDGEFVKSYRGAEHELAEAAAEEIGGELRGRGNVVVELRDPEGAIYNQSMPQQEGGPSHHSETARMIRKSKEKGEGWTVTERRLPYEGPAYKSNLLTQQSVDITEEVKDAALKEGFTLYQREPEAPKGKIRVGPRSLDITLLKGADRSTFFHETGHFYLKVMGDLASMPGAKKGIVEDYAEILDWLGVEAGTVAERRDSITEAQQEQWARGFEAYILEGSAPSAGLRAAFNQFRQWLMEVYKSLSELNVELTPAVRDVMDRLLTAQDSIELVQTDIDNTVVDLVAEGKDVEKITQAEIKKSLVPARRETVKGVILQSVGARPVFKYIREDKAMQAAWKKAERQAREAFKAGKEVEAAKWKDKMKDVIRRANEKVEKIQTEKQKMAKRRRTLNTIKKYLGLTDAQMKGLTKQRNVGNMTDFAFKQFKDDLLIRAEQVMETAVAKSRVMETIERKRLGNVEDYRKSLKLPAIRKMDDRQLREFADLLEGFHDGDVFLSPRKLELVDRTDLKGIRTWREAKERLSDELGIPVDELDTIKVGEFDDYRWDTSLAERNPFYRMLVEETAGGMISANARVHKIENEVYELARKSEKSRGRSLTRKLIPQDPQIMAYLEATDENRKAAGEQLTPEQLDLAHYMQQYYRNALTYLQQTNSLQKGRENYMVHLRRSFLEVTKDDGLLNAVKSLFQSYQLDEMVFNILDESTDQILPLEKFFKFSMQRTGTLTPTTNVTKAFLVYVQTMEKKMALDEMLPKLDIYTQAITPRKMTPRGLEADQSLKKFVYKFINNKKGRQIRWIGKQGGKVDLSIRALRSFVTLLDLGLNIPIGVASFVGEQTVTFEMLGVKGYTLGNTRMRTKKGKAILEKYQAFTGRSAWEEFWAPGKEIGDRLMEGMFFLFHKSSVLANKQFLLASLTKDEYNRGVIRNSRLAQIRTEMGRFRAIPGAKSLVGSTAAGGAGIQYKTWAVPVMRTLVKDFQVFMDGVRARKLSTLTTREARELYRLVGLSFVVLVMFGMGDKDDKSFVGQLSFKARREAFTMIQSISPEMWLSTPRLFGFVSQFGQNLQSILTLEKYKTKEGFKGVGKLKKQLTPGPLRHLGKEEKGKTVL